MDYKVHNGPGHTWQPDMTTRHRPPPLRLRVERRNRYRLASPRSEYLLSYRLICHSLFQPRLVSCVSLVRLTRLQLQTPSITNWGYPNLSLRLLESLTTFEALVSVTFSCLIFLRSQQHEMSVKPWKHKLNYFKTFIDCENIWLD